MLRLAVVVIPCRLGPDHGTPGGISHISTFQGDAVNAGVDRKSGREEAEGYLGGVAHPGVRRDPLVAHGGMDLWWSPWWSPWWCR